MLRVYLHVCGEGLVQALEAGPVPAAQGVGDGREAVGAVPGDVRVDRLGAGRVRHAQVVVQQRLWYHVLKHREIVRQNTAGNKVKI